MAAPADHDAVGLLFARGRHDHLGGLALANDHPVTDVRLCQRSCPVVLHLTASLVAPGQENVIWDGGVGGKGSRMTSW
jgi:hypothetical protein